MSARSSWSHWWASPGISLSILTGLNFLNYVDRSILSSVVTPLKAEMGISDAEIGWLGTAFMIGYFVTSPIFGFLGDRYARRWLIFAGILFWSIGTVFTGVATTLLLMMIMRILVGTGEASYATLSPSWIADLYAPARRNNAFTIFYTAIPVGYAVGFILGGQIAKYYGWREAFYFAGAPGLLLAFILLWMREPLRGESDAGAVTTEKPNWRDALHLMKITDYNLVVWGYTAYTFAMGAFAIWGPTFLTRVHQVPNDEATMFFGGVLVVSGLVGTMVGGFAATAWHKRQKSGYAWLSALSVLAAVPLSFCAFMAGNVNVSMICFGAAMFLLFLSTGPVNTMIVEAVPVNLRATAVAVSIFMLHAFGDIWSPVIVGALSDTWNSLRAAVMILPVALLICAFLWAWLARKIDAANHAAGLAKVNAL